MPLPLVPKFWTDTAEWCRKLAEGLSFALDQSLGPPKTGTCWDDLQGSVNSFQAGGIKDPDFSKLTDDGSGSTGVYCRHFDPTSEEELFFKVQFTHGYKEGSTYVPHIHWCPTDNGSGDVVWGLEFAAPTGEDEVIPNTTISTVTATASGTALTHQISSFGDQDGTGVGISDICVCRVFRDATNAADTYGADAGLLFLDFHIQEDSRGSAQRFEKLEAA